MLGLSELKSGQNIQIDGVPYVITWNQFSKSGRQGGVMKTKMKNLLTGAVKDNTFQGSDKVDEAEITYRKAQFLYATGDDYEFMDNETYEQMAFTKAQLGDTVDYLVDGAEVDIQNFDGKPINVKVATKMMFEIIETEPGVKGNTAGTVTKNAKIDTGKEIKVPPFIEKGEHVIVNTLTGEYVERAKK